MIEQGSQDQETRQTVLIADDDEALAEAIAETLQIEGLQTIVTHNGEQALALARALQPDVILLDVMMPGRSGIEICATLKTDPSTDNVPVIFITAKNEEVDRMVGLAAGADEYITKPFRPTELIDIVNGVLAGRPIAPRRRDPDLAAIHRDQLVVFAQEWKKLFERERAQREALEEANRRLSELDRLKAGFLSVVTHELLTPFGSIGMALQVLQRLDEDWPPDHKVAIDNLLNEIAGLHRLVNGVVKFAELINKQREPQPGHIALSQVIPWAVQPVAMIAQARQVDFRVFVPDDLPKIHADPDLLGEAIFQMAHNAVKFNQVGGQAHIQAYESDGWSIIEVMDTGVGLTPEQLELLGQPFEQSADSLRRGQEGLGVGWTFVRYVAEAHGGWTRVESPGPDQGSTFYLALPVVADEQEGDVNPGQNS